MQLVIGSILISLSVFAFCIVLLAFRNPRRPKWAADEWVGNLHSIVILWLGLGGLLAWGSIWFGHTATGITRAHILISALICIATAGGVKMMKIGKKLDEFKRRNALTLVPPPVQDAGPANNDHTPDKPEMAA